MSDCVIVIRTKQGEDILAFLISEIEGVIKVEHPFYVANNSTSNQISIVPYCALSDERYYEFNRQDIQFLVTANRIISSRFIEMIDEYEQALVDQKSYFNEQDEIYNTLESILLNKAFVDGNDTEH